MESPLWPGSAPQTRAGTRYACTASEERARPALNAMSVVLPCPITPFWTFGGLVSASGLGLPWTRCLLCCRAPHSVLDIRWPRFRFSITSGLRHALHYKTLGSAASAQGVMSAALLSTDTRWSLPCAQCQTSALRGVTWPGTPFVLNNTGIASARSVSCTSQTILDLLGGRAHRAACTGLGAFDVSIQWCWIGSIATPTVVASLISVVAGGTVAAVVAATSTLAAVVAATSTIAAGAVVAATSTIAAVVGRAAATSIAAVVGRAAATSVAAVVVAATAVVAAATALGAVVPAATTLAAVVPGSTLARRIVPAATTVTVVAGGTVTVVAGGGGVMVAVLISSTATVLVNRGVLVNCVLVARPIVSALVATVTVSGKASITITNIFAGGKARSIVANIFTGGSVTPSIIATVTRLSHRLVIAAVADLRALVATVADVRSLVAAVADLRPVILCLLVVVVCSVIALL